MLYLFNYNSYILAKGCKPKEQHWRKILLFDYL